MRNRIITALLCLCLLLSAALPAAAQEQEPQTTRLSISTVQRFLSFAEKCRLDSYSRNLVVSLETDLDLTDVEFQGIPIFCGTFEGNGHTISGLRLSGDGSAQGLFRHLTETALVRDLKVQGDVAPAAAAVRSAESPVSTAEPSPAASLPAASPVGTRWEALPGSTNCPASSRTAGSAAASTATTSSAAWREKAAASSGAV